MGNESQSRIDAITSATLDGPGELDAKLRRAIAERGDVPEDLAGYTNKVHDAAFTVTDEDVTELRRAGYCEDQIFEATLSAAIGAGMSRLEKARRALGRED